MKRLVKTKGMEKKTWLAYRRQGIGGSDAPVILGLSPYRSILELWEDKTGKKKMEEEENHFTYFGHVLEPVIKKEFMKRTGLKVRAKNCILQSEEYPFMLADLDGTVQEPDGSYSVFEAKTATEYKKEIWEKGIPEEYMAQVQHYLCVTGYQKAYVCALVGGNMFYCHVIRRDEAYIRMLVEKESYFWDCVCTGNMPEPDGSKATADFLNSRYKDGKKEEIRLPDQASSLLESYCRIGETMKELETEKNRITNELKNMMQENEKGYTKDHVVNWPMVVKHTLDSQKVKDALGDSYEDCLKEVRYRKFSVA